jgi:hypothetical protein
LTIQKRREHEIGEFDDVDDEIPGQMPQFEEIPFADNMDLNEEFPPATTNHREVKQTRDKV